MPTDKSTPKYAAPALEKGLDVLEVLAGAEQPMGLSSLAKAMGRSVSEIFRMALTLEQRGYLILDGDDRYRLSLKMLELSHRQQPLRSLVATATPLMRELAGRAYQSCHLSTYHDGQLLVVAQVDAPGPFTMGAKVGALGKLSDTASGKVLLAFRDDAERTRMLAAQVRIHGELEIDAAHLFQQIEEVRRNGVITSPSTRVRGSIDISYPIFGNGREVMAALTVPYYERLDRSQSPSIPDTEEIGREIAVRLSKLLGYAGDSETA
jgi:DNA-binding IclR family transcriptional regulator